MLPSSIEDFGDPVLNGIIHTTQRAASDGAGRQGEIPQSRWDAIGSEFGSRHQQYEMFYAGARFVTAGHSFRTYRLEHATGHGREVCCRPMRFARANSASADASTHGGAAVKVAIVNLGDIVSGDWRNPFVTGDTIITDGDRLAASAPRR